MLFTNYIANQPRLYNTPSIKKFKVFNKRMTIVYMCSLHHATPFRDGFSVAGILCGIAIPLKYVSCVLYTSAIPLEYGME